MKRVLILLCASIAAAGETSIRDVIREGMSMADQLGEARGRVEGVETCISVLQKTGHTAQAEVLKRVVLSDAKAVQAKVLQKGAAYATK